MSTDTTTYKLIERLTKALRTEADDFGLYKDLLAEADEFLKPKVITFPNPLPVPWYSQLDSETGMGWRMCFSSCCAMLLAYLKPGVLTGPNGDDQYLKRVLMYGDTTDPTAQIKALNYYGVKARLTDEANFSTVEKLIDSGIPPVLGWIHRGPVDAPRGSGHMLIAVGYTKTHLIVHDPNGEADLITGATLPRPARFCKYSKKNFGKRWLDRGPNTGRAIIAER
jgi:hypothetical protein